MFRREESGLEQQPCNEDDLDHDVDIKLSILYGDESATRNSAYQHPDITDDDEERKKHQDSDEAIANEVQQLTCQSPLLSPHHNSSCHIIHKWYSKG